MAPVANETITYTVMREDQSINETLCRILLLAKKNNQNVATILGGIRLEVTPSMDIGEVTSVWQQAFEDKKKYYQFHHSEKDPEEEAVKKEPFDVRDHVMYLKKIYDFYSERAFALSVPEFLAYWGKLIQLRTKKQPLTKELALQTMELASQKTGVSPTPVAQELMTAIWHDGKNLAQVLGQDVDYCDVHRAITSDEAMAFYAEYAQEGGRRRRSKVSADPVQKAGFALATILKTKKRIDAFYKILTGKTKLSPGAVLQVQPPADVLPVPSDEVWGKDPNTWNKYLRKVCDAAEAQLSKSRGIKSSLKGDPCATI